MDYTTLTQEERDDMLLQNIKNEERTLYSLMLQKVQYEAAIKDEPTGVKDAERRMLVEVDKRIAEIQKSAAGLYAILPDDKARIDTAIARINEKENLEATK